MIEEFPSNTKDGNINGVFDPPPVRKSVRFFAFSEEHVQNISIK